MIIYQSNKGTHFYDDDISASIGINKKYERFKKIRTETINKINHKFKIEYNTNSNLIKRIRSEKDRRFYKYIINETNGKLILS
jgi:hypothetical protein